MKENPKLRYEKPKLIVLEGAELAHGANCSFPGGSASGTCSCFGGTATATCQTYGSIASGNCSPMGTTPNVS